MSQNAVAAARGAETKPENGPVDPSHRRRWWILGVISIAQLMGVLDGTIVNIGLPSAQRDLGFSGADRQWVVTAYALAFGSLLLLGGRVADLVGRKVTFLVGLAASRPLPWWEARRTVSACSSPRARSRAGSPPCWPRPRCRF